MKKIKTKKLRKGNLYSLNFKVAILTVFFLLIYSILPFFKFGNIDLFTDILSKKHITFSELKQKSKNITFNGTTWPVKEITDLNHKHLSVRGITYEQIRKKDWKDVPEALKTTFPTKWSDYIRKYQNVNLKNCWKIFTDPNKLGEFTFRRRILRTIWTASYSSEKIWKKNTGTHAGIDIIANKGTPVYSIADGLVVIISKNSKSFGNYIVILHKVKGNYLVSFYGHLNSISDKIHLGMFVKGGSQIGTVGNTGNSFGTHLHFQINKVSSLKDIINGKIFNGWYHNLDGVKKLTIDPIEFIEKYYVSTNDSLLTMHKVGALEKKNNDKFINDNLSTKVKNAVNKSKNMVLDTNKNIASIKSVKISLIDNKVQIGNGFTLTLQIVPGHGAISILTSNTNLSYSPDLIVNPNKSVYMINFFAAKAGNTKIKISDGNSIREYDIQIYTKDSNKIAGLNIDNTKLNLLKETAIVLYPINKFGQKVNRKIIGNFKIYLEANGEKKFIKSISINDFQKKIYIKGKFIGKGKIIISSPKYYLKKNIITDIAKDYSYKAKYADELGTLVLNNIVKGDNGFILPNKKLTRRQLLIVLGRSILKIDYKKAKSDMINYIKTKGKFFKDIDGNNYSDPYIYYAWKKGIIKGDNGLSLADTYVTKGELLTILTRTFKIPVKENKLNIWYDLKSGKLKAVADTVKQYNLYPFENYKYFNSGTYVTREKAFVSLKYFIDFGNSSLLHASAKVDVVKQEDEDLQSTMEKVFDF